MAKEKIESLEEDKTQLREQFDQQNELNQSKGIFSNYAVK